MRKNKRILILAHSDLIPPDNAADFDLDKVSWRTEHHVISTLRELGHEVKVLGLLTDLAPIKSAKDRFKPHLAFNLLEEFKGEAVFDHNVVAYLELLGLAYTGCNPKGLLIARDKALSKKILLYHRIRTPKFIVAPRRQKFKRPKQLNFPLIVKALNEEGSWGISQNSVVTDDKKLLERIDFIHTNIYTHALVEAFIEGQDLYVSMFGNNKITVLPFLELVFNNAPNSVHQIATNKAKWDVDYRTKYAIELAPIVFPPPLHTKIVHLSKRIYRALKLSGYARLDLRITTSGDIYFIEANPNPDIAQGDEFALSAQMANISYNEMLEQILRLGRSWGRNFGIATLL